MLALIAGRGALPGLIARAARPGLVVGVHGTAVESVEPTETFRLEKLGAFLALLKARGVTEVCFAGGVERPVIDPSAVGVRTLPFVPRMMKALRRGDDGALTELLAIFEDAGFAIRAAHDLVPDLLPPPGFETAQAPDRDDDEEAIRAVEVLRAMGAADIGQSCVVHRGQVLAVEAKFGTDWMLQSLAARPDGRGGLLYKGPKPGQDRRVDLPTIGPATIEAAARAGLDGIAVEAGGVMVLDRAACVRAADASGMFLWVRKPSGAA